MSEFLLLIDGSSLLTTQFYGNLPREILFAKTPEEKEKYYDKIMMTSGGVHTNAVFGFLRTLASILRTQKPQYLAVAWDLTRETFRRKMYAPYKANREETLTPLKEQFGLCQKVLSELSVTQLCSGEFEADDFCGSAASRFESQIPVRLMSRDHDYLQLVTDRTELWMMQTTEEKAQELFDKYGISREDACVPEKTFPFNPARVKAEFGVTPAQIPALKGLMGDSSDNIKGVPGIGPDTAVRLIGEYGSIENLYRAIEGLDKDQEKALKADWKDRLGLKRSPLTALRKESDTDLVGRKAAELSESLATIRRDAPIPADLSDYALTVHPDAWRRVYAALEFNSLTVDFGEEEKKALWDESMFQRGSQRAEEQKLLSAAEGAQSVSIVPEAEGKTLTALTAASDDTVFRLSASPDLPSDALRADLHSVLAARDAVTVLDAKKIYHLTGGEEIPALRDAGVAAYLLNPLHGPYSPSEIAGEILDWHFPDYKTLFGRKTEAEASKDPAYALLRAREAAALRLAGPVLEERLKESGQWKLYTEIELPLCHVLYEMEHTGIRVKKEALAAYGDSLTGTIARLAREIWDLCGETFNIASPKQLGQVLFVKMGLKYPKKTKSNFSTSADILEKVRDQSPVIDKILEYRQLTKLKSTYADGLAECISEDGRIHTTFHQTITATGRISSTDPNLQNIPVREELGREIRKVFVPSEGCVFVDADYSQIELRVLAHLSGDRKLIAAYNSGKDIHAITASNVFHVPLDQVTPQQRRNAKAVNFGIVYGISAFGLSDNLSISRSEAMDYIARYFETYPDLHRYLNACVDSAREKGYAVTMYGRRRPVPELASSNLMQRKFGERVAMNSPIQGTAADIMKIAMLRVDRRLKQEKMRSKIVLQIHDELLLETPMDEKEKAAQILRTEMESAADLAVPLAVSLSEGESWYDAK